MHRDDSFGERHLSRLRSGQLFAMRFSTSSRSCKRGATLHQWLAGDPAEWRRLTDDAGLTSSAGEGERAHRGAGQQCCWGLAGSTGPDRPGLQPGLAFAVFVIPCWRLLSTEHLPARAPGQIHSVPCLIPGGGRARDAVGPMAARLERSS